MEYWIVYDRDTGAALYRGAGPVGTAATQPIPEGSSFVIVPQALMQSPEISLDLLRAYLEVGVDNEAERVRGQFITALPGQVGTYWLKAEVARKWLADNTSSTVMLASEARSRRMTIADLAAEVIANADAWAFVADAIEGMRWDAKFEMAQATTFGAIVEASKVDWSTIGHA